MSALERAEEDIRRGYLGTARKRLISYMTSQGYDADIAARIGQISYDMRDHCHAGRYWLFSNALGPHVDEAIDLFRKDAAADPATCAISLPRHLLVRDPQNYPQVVRQRLVALGLEAAVTKVASFDCKAVNANREDRIMLSVVLTIILVVAVIFLVGINTILNWLFA